MSETTPLKSADPAFTAAGLLLGARRSLPLVLSVGAYGAVFGVLARQAGLSLPEASLMSAAVFAGTAQFLAIGLWATPVSIVAVVAATLVVNLRLLMMGAALRPWLATLGPLRTYGSLFFLTDESWALTLREFEAGGRDTAFLLGSGLAIFVAWNGATVAGYTAGAALGDPARWGLDFAATAVFAALLAGRWTGRADLLPWATAAVVAVIVERIVPGAWYILAGGLAGSLVGAARYAP